MIYNPRRLHMLESLALMRDHATLLAYAAQMYKEDPSHMQLLEEHLSLMEAYKKLIDGLQFERRRDTLSA